MVEKWKAGSILEIAGKLAITRNEKVYLVGGYIRDLLLGRITYDIDFALKGNVEKFSRTLARRLRGNFFVMDEETQTFRIFYKCSGPDSIGTRWNIDISKMQGKDIVADLGRRDFTIDAMAVDLMKCQVSSVKCQSFSLIDPFSGLRDLKKGLIRLTSPAVLNDDPLRLLRAFRLAAILGFRIERKTLRAISARSLLIKRVSRERVRDELFKILSVDDSYKYFLQIDKAGLLEKVVPQVKKIKREPGLWRHSLLTLRFLEENFKDSHLARTWSGVIAGKTKSHLRNEISAQGTRLALLKFVSLFHDIGKPQTKKIREGKTSFIGHDRVGAEIIGKISESVRLSNREIKIMLNLARNHMRVHYLANLESITKRALARLIRDLDEETIELLLFTMADFMATPEKLKKQSLKKNRLVTRKIIKEYFKFKESKKFTRLINGNDLIRCLKMKEGPEIGRVLEETELAQREGRIRTRQEALRFASNLLNR
jgi:poly(A) polymerase